MSSPRPKKQKTATLTPSELFNPISLYYGLSGTNKDRNKALTLLNSIKGSCSSFTSRVIESFLYLHYEAKYNNFELSKTATGIYNTLSNLCNLLKQDIQPDDLPAALLATVEYYSFCCYYTDVYSKIEPDKLDIETNRDKIIKIIINDFETNIKKFDKNIDNIKTFVYFAYLRLGQFSLYFFPNDYNSALKFFQLAINNENIEVNRAKSYKSIVSILNFQKTKGSLSNCEFITEIKNLVQKNEPAALNALGYLKLTSDINSVGNNDNTVITSDENGAREYFQKAAEQDYCPAMFNLGAYYFNQYSTINNLESLSKARNYFEKAADDGEFLPALYQLALCHEKETSMKKAKDIYHYAASRGCKFSQARLGFSYVYGDKLCEKNGPLGIKYLQESADAGNSAACYNLGICFQNGISVEKDLDKAMHYYTLAAEGGNHGAELVLAVPYLSEALKTRYTDPIEREKTFSLFKNAFESDKSPDIMHNIGICYENGFGTPKNEFQAVSYYQQAAEKGHILSKVALGICCFNGRGIDKDENKACEYFTQASDAKNPQGQYLLSLCLRNGTGVQRNETRAFQLMKLASDQGYSPAHCAVAFYYLSGTPQLNISRNEQIAFNFFTLSAKGNFSEGQYAVGKCYQLGIGVEKNLKVAVDYFRKAIDQGHPYAQYELGNYYYSGMSSDFEEIIPKSDIDASRLIKLAVEYNYPPAQNLLGLFYKAGKGGCKKDENEAFKLFKIAADQGWGLAQYNVAKAFEECNINLEKEHCYQEALKYYYYASSQGIPEALTALGYCFDHGIGVAIDEKEAAHYYQLALEQNNSNAAYNLGILFENGIGVPKNEREAFRLFNLAASRHHPDSLLSLGLCYKDGIGISKDPGEAAKLYQLACDRGNFEAAYILGLAYEEGDGVSQNDRKAVKYYKIALDGKLAKAQYALGLQYETGAGVKIDLQKAFKCIKLAANQNLPEALNKLGTFYEDGKKESKIGKSPLDAFSNYQAAADLGYADAQYNLARCYKHGIGVPPDLKDAARYYSMASAQGHALAQCNLGVCYELGYGVEPDKVRAASFYKAAADKNIREAQHNLALCYERGSGVKRDEKEALRYFQLASQQNYAPSIRILKNKQAEQQANIAVSSQY